MKNGCNVSCPGNWTYKSYAGTGQCLGDLEGLPAAVGDNQDNWRGTVQGGC